MNDQIDEQQRSRWEFICFGLIFVGFVLAAGGMTVGSIPGALIGVALMGIGLLYFLIRE